MRFTLATKINLIFISILFILATIIGFVSYSQMVKSIKNFATEKAKGDLNLGYRFLDLYYPGDWYIKDGQLYKGDVLLNNNFEIVDLIGKETGDTVTIFQNNVRIATNVMKDGQRAVGTLLSEEVSEVVLKQGKNFYGEANVAGHIYQTAYKPLKNKEGEIIGVFYVGAPQNVINETISEYMTKFAAVFTVIIVISIITILIFTARIKSRLARIANALKEAGEGNFTVEIAEHAKDELSQLAASYNAMKKNLQEIIANVKENAKLVALSSQELNGISEHASTATEQITQSVQLVADGAEKQTIKIEDSLKAMEQLNAGVKQISENTNTIACFSNTAIEKANQGNKLVDTTVEQMEKINQTVIKCEDNIKELEVKSKRINAITKAINKIASQTNMLALNAAIEASRAGEAGKGFSVVAEQVGKLAIESQNSSNKIYEIIEAIQEDIQLSIKAVREAMQEVQEGLNIVVKTDENFEDIIRSIETIKEKIEEMSSISAEISGDAGVVLQSIQEVASISKNTASQSQTIAATTEEQLASAEELSASAASLANMAKMLEQAVGRFKI